MKKSKKHTYSGLQRLDLLKALANTRSSINIPPRKTNHQRSGYVDSVHHKYWVNGQRYFMNLWLLPTKNFVENECLLIVTQQVSDIKATMFYLQFIFVATGSSIPRQYLSVIFGVVLFESNFIVPCLVERSS